MKTRLLAAAILAALAFPAALHATVDDALSFAYEAATPYVQQGFTFREDAWGGDLGEKDQQAVAAQLFKGNEYWFITGTDVRNAIVTVHLYDSNGKLTEQKYWQKGRFSGAYIVPPKTGTYWAIVTIEKSSKDRTGWALVYGFK